MNVEPSKSHGPLKLLGERVRRRRLERGLTLAGLAREAKLSARFVGDLERGQANVSVLSLGRLASVLEVEVPSLLRAGSAVETSPLREETARALADVPEETLEGVLRMLRRHAQDSRRGRVALVGLRGAGKTTVGQLLARRAHVTFVELDRRIEQAAGMPLSDLFTLQGEEYFRTLERQTLSQVVEEPGSLVLEVGGGLVTSSETYRLLRESFLTIWLQATPEEHWNRVVLQGDSRPMRGQPTAMARLRELLALRTPLYALAHRSISTSRKTPEEIAAMIQPLVAMPSVDQR